MSFLANKARKDLLACIGICLAVAAAFSPSLANGFTNFDDNAYVTENPLVRSLAPANIKRIFTTTRPHTVFAPLVTLSFALEYRLWKLDPRGYHALNLLLHMLNALLAFFLLRVVSGAPARNIEVSASVYNVFDRAYGDVPSEEHFDSLDRSLNEIPQDGRSFRLKLTYGF